MKKIMKTLFASIGIILLLIYLLTGLFPFQKQVVWLSSKNYMNKTYPDFELQEIKVDYELDGNGYAITCYGVNSKTWDLRWDNYPISTSGIVDLRRLGNISMHTFHYKNDINQKIESLIANNFYHFSSSVDENLTKEEKTYMYDNQIEVKDIPIFWACVLESSEDELWTIEQFAEKTWQSIDTLMQNGIECYRIGINYNRENHSPNPKYSFQWNDSMGELTKDTILPLIQVVNQ